MDEEMEDFIEGFFEPSGIDFDYEFDAARFFDLTRQESYSEAQEAERWFESIGSYPPSPFIIKLNWRKDIPVENANSSPKSKDGENMNSISNKSSVDMGSEVFALDENNKASISHNDMAPDITKAKTKSVAKSSKPRSSTLMKPTASHLAKLNRARGVYSSCFLGRFQKPLMKIDERSSQNLPAFECEATKRQKLESGYLRKVAHLRHQTLLLHKVPEKVGPVDANSVHPRLKVTIAREPDLETANRAQRQRTQSQRSRNNSESCEHAKSNACAFKARPLNRKVCTCSK
uniref:TPX2 central domain-containing protein n=1 Tax=Davidia involucrata TaxID=16924 RepID=A0A5B7BQ17_DAVIN